MTVPWTPVLGDIATPGSLSSLAQETAAREAADAVLQAAISAIPATPVSSVFGRIGAIAKQVGDYNYSDLGNTPTTIAGYGITDFNSLGDARWVSLAAGGTVYNGTDAQGTVVLQVGANGSARNALKVWGKFILGNNSDELSPSSNSGFLHCGSFAGVTLGLTNGTVYLKAIAAGVSAPVGPFIQTTGGAPALATSTGVVGQYAWDSGFFYVCVATNTWKRTALVTF